MFGRRRENSATICKIESPPRERIRCDDGSAVPGRRDDRVEMLVRLTGVRN